MKRMVVAVCIIFVCTEFTSPLADTTRTANQCRLIDVGSNPADPDRQLGPGECIVITDTVSPYAEWTSGTPGVYGKGCLPKETPAVVGPDGLFRWVYLCGNDPRIALNWRPTGKKICPPSIPEQIVCPSCAQCPEKDPCPEAQPCPPQIPAPSATPASDMTGQPAQPWMPPTAAPPTTLPELESHARENRRWWIAPVAAGVGIGVYLLYKNAADDDKDCPAGQVLAPDGNCHCPGNGIGCEDRYNNLTGFVVMVTIPIRN